MLVLSLFPGIGLLDRAFEEEGFTVVRGPDVLWGGDVRSFHPPAGKFDGVIGGPPCQSFSPLANLVRARGREPRFGNLIPEFERCIGEAAPEWFLMENVTQAPPPVVDGYAVRSEVINNAWLGEAQERKRLFSFGLRGPGPSPSLRARIDFSALMLPAWSRSGSVTSSHVDNSPEAKGRRPAVSQVGAPPSQGEARAFRTAVRTAAVTSHNGTAAGRVDKAPRSNGRLRYTVGDSCELQGLPRDFLDEAPFTTGAKLRAIANGVPLPLGRALARAVAQVLEMSPAK